MHQDMCTIHDSNTKNTLLNDPNNFLCFFFPLGNNTHKNVKKYIYQRISKPKCLSQYSNVLRGMKSSYQTRR